MEADYEIGRGTFGVAYMARLVSSGEAVVVKIASAGDVDVDIDDEVNSYGSNSVRNVAACYAQMNSAAMFEACAFADLGAGAAEVQHDTDLYAYTTTRAHHNIVPRLLRVDVISEDDSYEPGSLWVALTTEAFGISLHDALRPNSSWAPALARDDVKRAITWQLLDCVSALHERNWLHRDIKPANTLLCISPSTGYPLVSLCDLGSARKVVVGADQPRGTPFICTRPYRAPELLCGTQHAGAAADTWSCAATIAELWLSTAVPGAEGLPHRGDGQDSAWSPRDAASAASDSTTDDDEGLQDSACTSFEDQPRNGSQDSSVRRARKPSRHRLFARVPMETGPPAAPRECQRQPAYLFAGATSDGHQLAHMINVMGLPTEQQVCALQLPPAAHAALVRIVAVAGRSRGDNSTAAHSLDLIVFLSARGVPVDIASMLALMLNAWEPERRLPCSAALRHESMMGAATLGDTQLENLRQMLASSGPN